MHSRSTIKFINRMTGPAIGVVLAGSLLGWFACKPQPAPESAQPKTEVKPEQPRPALLSATNVQPVLVNPATTNRAEPETGEDKIVALVTQGNQLLALGKHAEAAEKYEQALRLEPGDEDLHYNLGIALAKLGRNEEAKKQYAEALEIYPDYADARNNLGNLLMKEKKLSEAIEQFRAAIKLMPDNASFHNNLGTAYGRQGAVADALVEFREAVRLKPSYVEARVNVGNACLATGQIDEAMAQLTEALRLQPDFGPALQAMQRARQKQAGK